MDMKVSPELAGFLKGLGTVVVFAVVGFVASPENLGFLSPALAGLVASIFAAVESSMKAKANGEKGLFGSVSIQR